MGLSEGALTRLLGKESFMKCRYSEWEIRISPTSYELITWCVSIAKSTQDLLTEQGGETNVSFLPSVTNQPSSVSALSRQHQELVPSPKSLSALCLRTSLSLALEN